MQNSIKNEDYYFSNFKMVDQYLIEKSKKLYNKILPFIQFYLGYNILFRISFHTYQYLEKDMLDEYYKHLEIILNQIDEKYILEQKIFSYKEKLFTLSKKYHRDLRNEIIINNESMIYSGKELMNLHKNKGILVWRILNIKNNILYLEGKDSCILNSADYFYFCKSENKIYYPEYFVYSGYDYITTYGIINKGRIVVFKIQMDNNSNNRLFQFFLSYKGNEVEIFPTLGWFSPIPSLLNGYYYSGLYIMKLIDSRLTIFKAKEKLRESFENQYLNELNKLKKNNIIKLRTRYFEHSKKTKFNMTETWIINDKQKLARDNGEYFFRFLKKKNPKGIEFYFAIKKDCVDYQRLKPLGNIIELESERYLNLFLLAKKIISSVSESWVDNPFGNDRKFIRDLFNFDFIFIQNGILKDDLTKDLNRIAKNYALIVATIKKEYKHILSNKYHYNKNNVILTGLPRFDNLIELQNKTKQEKIILLMPTWRKYIKGSFDLKSFESIYYHSFVFTDYFKFYNNLINDDKLLAYMNQLNYRGIFCLHPNLQKQRIDFRENKYFLVKESCNIQNLILKSSLLVTDYSSVFFDFAYLEKPIIYTHFDYDEYLKNHSPKGYFNYAKHGFGPICFDLNCTINEIISKMKDNCLMDNKYLKRKKDSFYYKDNKNCERLYYSLINNSGIIYIRNKIETFIIKIVLFLIFLKYIIKMY